MSDAPPKSAGRKHFFWQCQKCGHVVVAKEAPDGCEACGAPKQDFVLLEHD
jgi:rubrerythrin